MENKLLPCPFCGSNEEIRVTKHGMYGVHCICGASLFGFETSEKAIEAWNIRRNTGVITL